MKRSGDKRIGLWSLILFLAACTAPPPQVIRPTASPPPSLTVAPRPSPTVYLQPLPTFTSTMADAAWQVWPVSFFPKSISSLALQDDRLWVGTEYGLWQIDPKTRRIVRHDTRLGGVHLLLPLENGQAWAGASRGVFFFDGQDWSNVIFPNTAATGPYRPFVYTFAIDQLGNLWMETAAWRGGINIDRYYGHVPTAGRMAPNREPYYDNQIVDSRDCDRWPIVMRSYLQVHRSAEECRAVQLASQTVPTSPYGSQLTLDADGSLWRINLGDYSISHWVNGTGQPVDLPPNTRVNAVASDPAHGIWLGTDRGLVYADGTELRWLPDLDQYFTAGRPLDLGVESSGDVWVQTAESTLNWLPADRSSPQFKTIAGIGAHAMAAADGLWITQGADLTKIKLGDPPSAPAAPPLLGDCKLEQLTTDRAGDVWATTRCGVAWQYQPGAGRWLRHALAKPAPFAAELDPIQQIVVSADGTVYAVGLSGLGELTAAGDTITATTGLTTTALPYPTDRHRALFPANDMPVNRPQVLNKSQSAADQQGGMWLAIINQPELWHYANGQISTLPHPLTGKWVSQLHVDRRGWLWEAGNDQQLAVYDGRVWRTVALPDLGIVRRIADDPAGRLWFLGDRGVAVYDPAKDDQP